MTKNEISSYRDGYQECRLVIVRELQAILEEVGDIRSELSTFVDRTLFQMDEDHWASIQEEFPGITHEEYERENELFLEMVEKTKNAHRSLKLC